MADFPQPSLRMILPAIMPLDLLPERDLWPSNGNVDNILSSGDLTTDISVFPADSR